jgi:hypothetical protein
MQTTRVENVRIYRDGRPLTIQIYQHSALTPECKMRPDFEQAYQLSRAEVMWSCLAATER